MAGKGGGAWKVAYADFVTAMMAFFLVMWIVAQGKPVKEAVAQYFRDPTGYGNRPGSNSPIPGKESGTSIIDKGPYNTSKVRPVVPSNDAPEQRTGARNSRIALGPEDDSTVGILIPFPEESAELGDSGKLVLNQLLPDIAGKISKLELRGHTSGRKLTTDGPYKNVWELSFARSQAVMEYLLQHGIDPRRIRLSQGGSNEPQANQEGLAVSHQAARVEVYVLSEVVAAAGTAEKARKPKKGVPKRPSLLKSE